MRPRLPLLVAGALALGALAWDLGGYPLLVPGVGRNPGVMRELAAGGPWWLPRLNDLPYVDKPIVHYAAGALALRLDGRTETAARIPSLVFTLATLGVVWWFARRTIGPGAAWPAVIATAATPFTLAYARTVICDAAVTLWITVAITAFACAVVAAARGDPRRGRWTLLGCAALALGALTKGVLQQAEARRPRARGPDHVRGVRAGDRDREAGRRGTDPVREQRRVRGHPRIRRDPGSTGDG